MQGEDIGEARHRREITTRRKALRIDFTGKSDSSAVPVSALNLHRSHRHEIGQGGARGRMKFACSAGGPWNIVVEHYARSLYINQRSSSPPRQTTPH